MEKRIPWISRLQIYAEKKRHQNIPSAIFLNPWAKSIFGKQSSSPFRGWHKYAWEKLCSLRRCFGIEHVHKSTVLTDVVNEAESLIY